MIEDTDAFLCPAGAPTPNPPHAHKMANSRIREGCLEEVLFKTTRGRKKQASRSTHRNSTKTAWMKPREQREGRGQGWRSKPRTS